MSASTKEEIIAEAMSSFQSVEVMVGKAKIILRELSVEQRRKLDESIFETKDGEFVSNGKGGHVVRSDLKYWDELWISATAEPAFTVENLIPWPASLKQKIGGEARKINGIEPAEETAKNS